MPDMFYDWKNQRIIDESGKQNMFQKADNIRELALKTGLHPLNLESTIERYNNNLTNNKRDEFDREHRPLPINSGPYYSIRMSGWSLCSFAGLGINENFEVIKSSGEPIKNLYAIGEVIGFGATSGNAYVNGMGDTPALTYGRLLGQNISST